jgi:hypothetical protein
MQNSKTEHVCDLKVITNRYQSGPVVLLKGISFLFALYNLYLFALIKIKRIKKAEVFKCRICGRYEWKCPYCNSVEVLDTVPRLHKCKECDKNLILIHTLILLFTSFKMAKNHRSSMDDILLN